MLNLKIITVIISEPNVYFFLYVSEFSQSGFKFQKNFKMPLVLSLRACVKYNLPRKVFQSAVQRDAHFRNKPQLLRCREKSIKRSLNACLIGNFHLKLMKYDHLLSIMFPKEKRRMVFLSKIL